MIATTAHDGRRSEPAAAPWPARPAAAGLSRDEEVELAARVARGDRRARDRMAEANLGLVRTIARDFRERGLEWDDLVGEGHLGLLRAAERFDPAHGVRFSTYAAYWIKEAIRRALIDTAPTIRLPAHLVRTLARWRRAERALRREGGRPPQFEEVAAALGLSAAQRERVARAMEARRLAADGDDRDGGGAGRVAEVADRRRGDERLEAEDDRALLLRRLARLDDRERTVVALRYGLGGEPLTQAEVGRRLGMTREGARKVELRALARLGEASTAGEARCAHPRSRGSGMA